MKEIKILKKTQVNLKDSTDPLGSSVCDLEGYKGGATSWHVASPVAKGWVPALLPRWPWGEQVDVKDLFPLSNMTLKIV